ncbi:uncharacterized protein GLRG_11225 [Colletotrichum graminicola M1.001]|uniref:Uncharacterized protein n=1 Tax=Colletotrichum graminicola (strain M1.001 / M2 / FGSC 10212) TaxID=645133 RepID=E3QYZ3_COLGM|nr:uncharacterized protein GLRG_11225 [Colletotrichum graminicola M1.001]EFQ36081.1 hypothetical protein GLRG_11225 [Colletotrichum graminicola M1.001]
MDVYDSLSRHWDRWKPDVERTVSLLSMNLDRLNVTSLLSMLCNEQTNDVDCGVMVLINSAYLIIGRRLPSRVDVALWRRTLMAFIPTSGTEAPWNLHADLDDMDVEIPDEPSTSKLPKLSKRGFQEARAIRRQWEETMTRLFKEKSASSVAQLATYGEDVSEVLHAITAIQNNQTPEAITAELSALNAEVSKRGDVIRQLLDLPNRSACENNCIAEQRRQRRFLKRRLCDIRNGTTALGTAREQLEVEKRDVEIRIQRLRDLDL